MDEIDVLIDLNRNVEFLNGQMARQSDLKLIELCLEYGEDKVDAMLKRFAVAWFYGDSEYSGKPW